MQLLSKDFYTGARLNTMERAYLNDLCEGRFYSLFYSPSSVRNILKRLLFVKAAEPYTADEGRENDMVRVTEYGKQLRGEK